MGEKRNGLSITLIIHTYNAITQLIPNYKYLFTFKGNGQIPLSL